MLIFRRLRNLADRVLPTPSSLLHRSATVEPLPQKFDRKWYLNAYPDVVSAGADPLHHFLLHGEAEGRNPNASFSTSFYRKTYMQSEPPDASPWRHYLRQGRELGYETMSKERFNYVQFVAAQEQAYGTELPELVRHVSMMILQPLMIIYIKNASSETLEEMSEMLRGQIYNNWELFTNIEAVYNKIRGMSADDWCFVWMDKELFLHSSALYCYASKFNESQAVDVIYCDEDELDGNGYRSRPFFKPDWSPDYFESFDYLGAGTAVSGRVCEPILRHAEGLYDFLLRATEIARAIAHIRLVLIHRTAGLDREVSLEFVAGDMQALRARLQRTGRVGEVTALGSNRRCYETRLELRSRPLISIVIPTAGKVVEINGRKTDLLFNCLDHISAHTRYEDVEIVVIHNNNLGKPRLASLVNRGVKTIAYHGEFNVARKLNIGAEESRGEYLLLLNDDVEPITPDWIERLLEQFEKPHVGVVGAKLLFPTLQIQHAGVVMLDAKPDHLRFKFPRDDEGYFFSTCAVRNFSAVTGAVMMTRASLFREIGGYTEALPINFNDVDYCLKAARAGYTTVYTPHAELIHHESMSRKREVLSYEVERFEKAWSTFTTDAFYNEAMLNKKPADYRVIATMKQIG